MSEHLNKVIEDILVSNMEVDAFSLNHTVSLDSFNRAVDVYKAAKLANLPKKLEGRIAAFSRIIRNENLKGAVIGVSGGIDSAVTTKILMRAEEQAYDKGYEDFQIAPVCINFKQYSEVFDISYVNEFLDSVAPTDTAGTHPNIIDLSKVDKSLCKILQIDNPDVKANVNYALRYTAFFAIAQDTGAVTVGTTNLDEMGVIGWFGKNSDMVVDFQLIHDFHKFEIVEAAKILGVPESIINRSPTGDLISGETDEEVFGCSYDQLSLLTYLYQNNTQFFNPHASWWRDGEGVGKLFPKVVEIAKSNSHKYKGQGYNPRFVTIDTVY